MTEILDFNKMGINTQTAKRKIKFYQGTKARRIFHYTSIGGLKGILESATLRFTNINYLNDKDEIKAGMDSLAKTIAATDEEKEKIFSSIRNRGMQTFVCCFSLDEDSLPMWNYYTKEINNQGYNIEFNDKSLVESIILENPELAGCELSFGVVEYCKDNDSKYSKSFSDGLTSSFSLAMMKLLFAFAKDYLKDEPEKIKKWESEIAQLENDKNENDISVYSYNGQLGKFQKDTSGNYLCFVKRDCFLQEKELRIVINVPEWKLAELKQFNLYKYRISNGLLVPYLELKFSYSAIQGLTVSPTIQSDLAEQSIHDFLQYCNFSIKNPRDFIKKSKIPVRF